MTTLDQVRLGLAARLNTIVGLRVHPLVPPTIDPPAAFIGAPTITEYRSDPETVLDASWEIGLAVSSGVPEQQLQLFPLLERSGAWSVFAAIEADRTLGGLDVDVVSLSARPFNQQELGGNKYYVATVSVRTLIG